VEEGFRKFLEFEDHQVQFNDDVSKTLKTFEDRLDEIRLNGTFTEQKLVANLYILVNLLHAKMEADEFQRGIESCRNHRIPNGLIPPNVFTSKLREYESHLSHFNQTLALPSSKYSHYLKLPVANCLFTTTSVKVVLNIPVRNPTRDRELYEIVHAKFAFNGQVCDLYPQESSYVAQTGAKTVLVNSHMLHHCKVHDDKMCLIPPCVKESAESINCAVGIMQGKTVKELAKACSFRFSYDTDLIISQVSYDILVLTNVRKIQIQCLGRPKETHAFPLIGNVHV
jgi:hypothetical protein